RDELEFLQSKLDCCLVIDGESLQLCLNLYKNEFIEITTKLSAAVACRCSPTQKADVARLIRHHTRKRVCCIGDGGNNVSMIQAADVGKQASLAADFSVDQFSHLTKLIMWHGRNSYRRSAKLAQFVIHRGLIISIMQAVFSAIFYFAPIALYQGWLMLGVYQGAAIMIMSLLLFETEFLNIVSISFTALVINELIMVALEITTCIAFLLEYFDLDFVVSTRFAWKVAVIVAVSARPLYVIKVIRSRIAPAASSKLL
ncbi:hypothetical protein CY34DRAFT_110257, partial [Suillus luteus UH-Slu-Lm8-n1]